MEIQQDVIDRCLKGDKKAEHELYQLLYSFLMSICRRYVRQDEKAREMLNIGFCRLLININKYRPVAPFQYWARTVMVNVILNELKKEKVHYGNFSYVEQYHEDDNYAALNDAIKNFDMAHIVKQIEKLPAANRQVFNLFIIDGYSHKEIAAFLGISEGTSKWHLNAAREKLKVMLTEKKTSLEIHNDSAR
jgi:RNA polymerase sigma-70 factor (ECF subfamily)